MFALITEVTNERKKQERFKRIAEARVNKIIAMLRLLGNCSFTGNYEYEEEQVEKIFCTLHLELDKVYNRFKCEMRGKGRFSLVNTKSSYNAGDYEDPTILLPLPDGTHLRATAIEGKDYPSIDIWLQKDGGDDQSVAFVEYNKTRNNGKELCIGVCNSQSEDPYFYESFHCDKNEN